MKKIYIFLLVLFICGKLIIQKQICLCDLFMVNLLPVFYFCVTFQGNLTMNQGDWPLFLWAIWPLNSRAIDPKLWHEGKKTIYRLFMNRSHGLIYFRIIVFLYKSKPMGPAKICTILFVFIFNYKFFFGEKWDKLWIVRAEIFTLYQSTLRRVYWIIWI